MTRETIIVLSVLDDRDGREWWQGLGLPDPARWLLSDTFGGDILPRVVLEGEVVRERERDGNAAA